MHCCIKMTRINRTQFTKPLQFINLMKKILIAEDEKALAKALQLKLDKEKYEVTIVDNGQEALAVLSKSSFDLIITDLVMPVMDGFALLTQLKSRNIQTPSVVLSNLNQDEDIARVKELGAKEFLVKSNIQLAEIVSYIKTILKE